MIYGIRWIKSDEIRLFHNSSRWNPSSSKRLPVEICFFLKSTGFTSSTFLIQPEVSQKPTGRHYTKYRFSPDIGLVWYLSGPEAWWVPSFVPLFVQVSQCDIRERWSDVESGIEADGSRYSKFIIQPNWKPSTRISQLQLITNSSKSSEEWMDRFADCMSQPTIYSKDSSWLSWHF